MNNPKRCSLDNLERLANEDPIAVIDICNDRLESRFQKDNHERLAEIRCSAIQYLRDQGESNADIISQVRDYRAIRFAADYGQSRCSTCSKSPGQDFYVQNEMVQCDKVKVYSLPHFTEECIRADSADRNSYRDLAN